MPPPDQDFVAPVLYFGTIAVVRGTPPSRGNSPTLTFQMPVDLARTWPAWATHVAVEVDDEGVHLRPIHGHADPKPPPPAKLPFDTEGA